MPKNSRTKTVKRQISIVANSCGTDKEKKIVSHGVNNNKNFPSPKKIQMGREKLSSDLLLWVLKSLLIYTDSMNQWLPKGPTVDSAAHILPTKSHGFLYWVNLSHVSLTSFPVVFNFSQNYCLFPVSPVFSSFTFYCEFRYDLIWNLFVFLAVPVSDVWLKFSAINYC